MDIKKAIAKATFAYDQQAACIDEVSSRVPQLMMQACREGGPLYSMGKIPEMNDGEWEIIRLFAQLGWAHFGMTTCKRLEAETNDG